MKSTPSIQIPVATSLYGDQSVGATYFASIEMQFR